MIVERAACGAGHAPPSPERESSGEQRPRIRRRRIR
jgi:hypothetical protein